MSVCSPHIVGDVSCYDFNTLKDIAKAYNKTHPNSKIIIDENKEVLWQSINKIMTECKNERCWLKYLSTDTDNFFKPLDPNDELMTDMINRVMRQYEKKYKNFQFLNALPADAYIDKVYKTYGSPIKKGSKKSATQCVGIIFNTDPHNKGGEHWVATFIKNNTIEYFDSLGNPPKEDFLKFYEKYYPNHSIKINKIVHQYGGIDCGVYALNFITKRLDGKTFENLTKNRMMIERKVFFE